MARELIFNQYLVELLNDVKYTWRQNAIVLGGTSGSGGGYGSPPGGFIGSLPQSRVSGDTDELRVLSSGSASSLLWNLNRIRYWETNQISASAPSPTFAGQIWVDGSSGSALNIRNESDTGWIPFTGSGGVLDPNNPQDVGASAVVGSSGSSAHGNHVHRGVSSVSAAGGAYAYGNVQLIAGTGVTLSQSSGSITIDSTVASGVSSVNASGYPYATGAIELFPGTNISLSQSSGSITINNTLGAGGVEFDTATPLSVAATGAVGSSGSPPHADHVHRGVTSISQQPSGSYAYGNIALIGGSNVTITQSSGSFTFDASSGSGGGGATIYQSAYASPPGSPVNGDEWHSENYIAHRASSAWTYYGALRAMEPPLALTNWTIFNASTVMTTDDTEGAIHFKYITAGGDHIRGIKRAFPSPVKVTIAFSMLGTLSNNYTRAGICVSDGTKYKTWQKTDTPGNVTKSYWTTADGLASEGGVLNTNTGYFGPIFWMQYEEDSTNRIVRISNDGFYWYDFVTEDKTTDVTGTQWGFALFAEGSVYATLLHVHEG